MISTNDITKLPFTPDLIESGTSFAVRALLHAQSQAVGSIYTIMRRRVSGLAVELAFRRYLLHKNIPFEIKSGQSFADPDRYDVLLGGHRCNLITFLTAKREQITSIRANPEQILQAPALLTEKELASIGNHNNDLNLFSFLLGLTTNSPEEIKKAVDANQPICLVHPLRPEWSHPQHWASMGKLTLKSECSLPVVIEIGGQDKHRNFITETLTLHPLTRCHAMNEYYSLAYVQCRSIPDARIGIHSTTIGSDIYLIHAHEWGNIWIYGMEIWMTGYISHEEFRRKASIVYTGSRVFQYSKTQTRNLSVPIMDLRPLNDLFEKVTTWENGKRHR